MATHTADVAVVGAGILGIAHAYALARRGRSVVVFERSPQAAGASVRNFGMIWPIGQPAGRMHAMALRSRDLWIEILTAAGLPHFPTGSLHVVYRPDEAAVAREFCEVAPKLGYRCEWLTAAAVLARSPAVRPEGLLGAIRSPTEITVDPRVALRQLPGYLAERFGVQFRFDMAVKSIDLPMVEAGGEKWQVESAIVCTGHDFETLYPEMFRASGLTRCKLQMMRTRPQPEGWQLGPALAAGLTLRFYESFEVCTTLPALKERIAAETPEYDRWGIHVLVSQTAGRELTVGDSHEYGAAIDPFDHAEIDDLILHYARGFLRAPALEIGQHWHGVYAKHPEKPVPFACARAPCTRGWGHRRRRHDAVIRPGRRHPEGDGILIARVTAVILDWAGTAVDHGSLAPVRTLQSLFAARGTPVTEEEARRDMGIHKKDHIRALLRVKTGEAPDEAEVENVFRAFIPMQMDCLAAYSAVIPGVPAAVAEWRARGIKIGSTTGYTRAMLDLLLASAAAEGYRPDCALCPEDAGAGRPWPWMCYLNAIRLRTYPMHTMVKIGDTISDIDEGRNAGMWTIGIARTGNMIGLTAEELAALPATEQAVRLDAARRKLSEAGAHYIADAVADCIPRVEQIEARLAKGERP